MAYKDGIDIHPHFQFASGFHMAMHSRCTQAKLTVPLLLTWMNFDPNMDMLPELFKNVLPERNTT